MLIFFFPSPLSPNISKISQGLCGERRCGGDGERGRKEDENTVKLNEFLLNNIHAFKRGVCCKIHYLRYDTLKNANTDISLLSHLDS